MSSSRKTTQVAAVLLMEQSEFDKFADEYRSLHAANIAVSGEGPDYFAEYKIKDLAAEYPRACGR